MTIIEALYNQYHTPDELVGELVWQEKFLAFIDAYPRRTRVVFQNLTLYAGNDKTYVIYVKDRDLNEVDVTGATGVFTMKEAKGDTSAVVTKSTANAGEGEIGAGNHGEIYFYLEPDDTKDLDIRQYVFDMKVILANGNVYTVLEGTINLTQPVNPTP